MAILGRWSGGVIASMQPGTSWAAPNGLFPTQDRNDSSTYSFNSSTSTITIPSSGLPDGYLLRASFEFEDSSNGRMNPAGKFVQTSGTGNFVSTQVAGYNRDSSEDRSFVNVSAIVDSPSASSTFQFQWIRDTDAPNGTDGTVQSHIEIIPLYYSAIGMYDSTNTSLYDGATATAATLDNTVYESDTAAIQRIGNDVTLKTDNKKYLILGGHYRRGGGTRTARNTAIMYDGSEDTATRGYMYIRSTADDIGGALSWDIKERVTTDIDVNYAVFRGPSTYAADNGAVENAGSTPSEAYTSLVVIELNDNAEAFRTKDDTGLQSDTAGTPVDLNISRTSDIDFNDSASWTRASDTAMNAEVTMDAFLAGNIWTARSSSSGARRTTRGHITVNGTEDAATMDGAYSRGDQSTSGTFNGGFNPAGFVALTAGDDVGMSQTAITGSEAGTPRTQAGTVGFIGINLDTLEAASSDLAVTATAPFLFLTPLAADVSTATSLNVTATSPFLFLTPLNPIVSTVSSLNVSATLSTLTLTEQNTTVGATPSIEFEMSLGAGSDGAAVTSRLTGFTGTLGGRFTETANPTGTAVDLAADGHRLDTWSIEATADALDGETYEFRVLYDGSPADTITQTPEVTIDSGTALNVIASLETLTLTEYNTTVVTTINLEVSASFQILSLIPFNTTVTTNTDLSVVADPALLFLNPLDTTVNTTTNLSVNASLGSLFITPLQASVSTFQDLEVTASNATLLLLPAPTTVSGDHNTEADTGVLTLTGFNPTVSISDNLEIIADVGNLLILPQAATVFTGSDLNLTANFALLNLTPYNTTVNNELNVEADSQTLTLFPYDPIVTLQNNLEVTATSQLLILFPRNATISTSNNLNITADVGSLVLNSLNATVDITVSLSIISTLEALSLTPYNATVNTTVNLDVTATSDSLSLNPFDADVSLTFNYTSNPDKAFLEFNRKTPTVTIQFSQKYVSEPSKAYLEIQPGWRIEERPSVVMTRALKYNGDWRAFKPGIPVRIRR